MRKHFIFLIFVLHIGSWEKTLTFLQSLVLKTSNFYWGFPPGYARRRSQPTHRQGPCGLPSTRLITDSRLKIRRSIFKAFTPGRPIIAGATYAFAPAIRRALSPPKFTQRAVQPPCFRLTRLILHENTSLVRVILSLPGTLFLRHRVLMGSAFT